MSALLILTWDILVKFCWTSLVLGLAAWLMNLWSEKLSLYHHISPDLVFVCQLGFLPSLRRDFPCNNITTEWEMPLVNPALIERLEGSEWSDLRPSPECQCSTSKKLTMLPECAEGAGGLPPPQVDYLRASQNEGLDPTGGHETSNKGPPRIKIKCKKIINGKFLQNCYK